MLLFWMFIIGLLLSTVTVLETFPVVGFSFAVFESLKPVGYD
jgi:hypothetical protein